MGNEEMLGKLFKTWRIVFKNDKILEKCGKLIKIGIKFLEKEKIIGKLLKI